MPGTCGLVHRVEELMRLYGEIWTTQDSDRLGEIFSDDIRYIEKPERVMDGMAELREYWVDHVGLMEETLYEPLYDEFDISDAGSWAWVKFRAGFKKPNSHRKANQWVARLTINQDGLISVFEEYWSKINWKVVGLETWLTKTVLVSARQDVHRCVSLAKLACEPLLRERAFATSSLLAALQKCAGEAPTSAELFFSVLSNGQDSLSASEFATILGIHGSQLVPKLGHTHSMLYHVAKGATKEDLLLLFTYIDTDMDGSICLSDFQDAMNGLRYVCKRRICITDSAEIAPGVEKHICLLDEGDIVFSLGMPFHVMASGAKLTRVKCKLPGSREIGFATISGTHGRTFLDIDSPTSKLLLNACQSLESALESIDVLEEAVGIEYAYIEEADSPTLLANITSRVALLHSNLTAFQRLLKSIHSKVKDCTTSLGCKIDRLQVDAKIALHTCAKLDQNFGTELTAHIPKEDVDECIMVSSTAPTASLPHNGEATSISKAPQCAELSTTRPNLKAPCEERQAAKSSACVVPKQNTAKPKAQTPCEERHKAKSSACVTSKRSATPFELQMKAFHNALTSNWPHHLGARATPPAFPSCGWSFPGGGYGPQLGWHASGNTRGPMALHARSHTSVTSSSSSSCSSSSGSVPGYRKKRKREPRKSKGSKKRRHRSSGPQLKKKRRQRSFAPSASLHSKSSLSSDREQRKSKSSKKRRHRSATPAVKKKLCLRSVARSASLYSKSSSRSHRRSVSRSLNEAPEIEAPSISGILVLE